MAPQLAVGDVVYHAARSVQNTVAPFTLPIGAIIGIACGGGVLLFTILTVVLIRCARRRSKRVKKSKKRPDLDEDAETISDVRRNASLESSQKKSSSEDPFRDRRTLSSTNPLSRNGPSPTTSTVNLLPPHQIGYDVTKFHDSWPLVNWTQAPTVPLTFEGQVYNPIAPTQSPPEKRQEVNHILTQMRPQTVLLDSPSAVARQVRISPTKKHSHQRSVSDNHLSSILRSTSQRLRDAKRMPRTASILSQASGHPPANKLPTPILDSDRTPSLTDKSDYEESVKSSVLDMFSNASSPEKRYSVPVKDLSPPNKDSSNIIRGAGSDDDSLYGDTSDTIVPAALTSPSKRSIRAGERQRLRISSGESPVSIRIREHNRTSTSAFGERDIFAHHRVSSTSSRKDSIEFLDEPTLDQRQISLERPQFGLRKTTFGQHQRSSSFSEPLALHTISGNRSPVKITTSQLSPVMDQIDWSKEIDVVIRTSPNPQQPKISKKKGHQRSKTVRLSGIRRSRSVSVLQEETEDDLSPPAAKKNSAMTFQTSTQRSSELPESSRLSFSRPISRSKTSSTSTFPSFLALPKVPAALLGDSPTLGGTEIGRARTSYSATLSFYDYYSSDPKNASRTTSPEKEISRDKAKNTRQGRDVSAHGENDPHFNDFVFPTPQLPGLGEAATIDSAHTEVPESFISAIPVSPISSNNPIFSIAPPSISRLHGPRSPPTQVPRDSVASSIAQLRRMNSAVSSYSNAYSVDGDQGSPTLPALRGGGISPTRKSGVRGSKNYLSLDIKKAPKQSGSTVIGRAMDLHAQRLSREPTDLQDRKAWVSQAASKKSPGLRSSHDISEQDRALYSGDIPSSPPVFSFENLNTNGETLSPLEHMSSGLKIHGLRLPSRDLDASPTKEALLRQNGTTLASEQDENQSESPVYQRFSNLTPKPPKGMSTFRPQAFEKLQQPAPRNNTPPKWSNGWQTVAQVSSPGDVDDYKHRAETENLVTGEIEDVFYRPSPTYEQLNFESPTRASFEAAVKDGPLQMPVFATRDSFEEPRGVPAIIPVITEKNVTSLRTGKTGRRGASGNANPAAKTRVDSLKWQAGNATAAGANSSIDGSESKFVDRGIKERDSSPGLYDKDGFLRSSPERKPRRLDLGGKKAMGGMI